MNSTQKTLTKRGGVGVLGTDTDEAAGPKSPSPSNTDIESNGGSIMTPISSNNGGDSLTSRKNSNINNNNNKNRSVSAKEKADFNARLEERRKQRHNQRTRRKERQDKILSSPSLLFSGKKRNHKRYLCFQSRLSFLLAVMFGTVLCGWMATFLYLTQNMEFQNNGVKSPLQLMRNRGGFLKPIAANIKDNIKDVIYKFPERFGRKNTKKADNFVDTLDGAPLQADEHEVIDMRILNAELSFANDNGGVWTQGWDVKPVELTSDKPLKIFVVPHSHCDPGWIKTFDEYFQSQTKQILSAIIASLLKDPRRNFIWAEISYFEWWWKEQSERTKEDVKMLMKNKQFEFVTGGWVQPDEANTQLYAMEIQLEEGHDFIREAFGEEYIPKYGWSIDPFGYSPTMAYLLKKHGFKAMLIQRVHYAIKKELALHKNLEFMWRQTWDDSANGEHDILAHVMPFFSYDVPHTCGPDPSVCCQFDFARVPRSGFADYVARCPWHKDAKIITKSNVKERSLLLLDQYRKKANLYRTNVVIAPLGDDFRYRDVAEADLQFENYQKIFDYINNNVANVEISFGKLSDYFETILKERRFEPPVLKGAFFTYSDREQDYWSGYFTSRIFDKALDRKLERVLYAASSMGATKEELQGPRRSLSLFQHHDGVTGTAKNEVVRDYAKRIDTAITDAQTWILHNIVSNQDHERFKNLAKKLKLMPCWQAREPRSLSKNLCDHTEAGFNSTKIIVYNPLETEQYCGEVVVRGRTSAHATFPCEIPGPLSEANDRNQKPSGIRFDPKTGLMTHPIKEEWMVWKVSKGGAYLFFPGKLQAYQELGLEIQDGGTTVLTKHWKRTVVERIVHKDENDGRGGIAIDFIYETFLQTNNEEWFARFTSPEIQNQGVFHTDLNGFNFDTHHFRTDMPIQSQVFPMPTLASIEDSKHRMTVLSDHAQGAASLEESAIDVWLDRRLAQDDDRGLASGISDNVPTRTRLRVVLEEMPTRDNPEKEFSITAFCKRQWKELNHPLELFGSMQGPSRNNNNYPFGNRTHPLGAEDIDSLVLDNRPLEIKRHAKLDPHEMDRNPRLNGKYNIAVVYMVNTRVDYLKESIDSLRESDYPKTLPLVISHDSHNREIVEYVDSLKSEFEIIQLFHPYSCADHKFTFPGEDPKLNENYAGDTYGSKRDSKVTCCKHHFSWMINTAFGLGGVAMKLDGFLFLEEDYIVAPTVYETIQKGFTYIDSNGRRNEFFGVTLDPTEGFAYEIPLTSKHWIQRKFVTGPMAFRRDVFAKIKSHASDFCTFDDYNWDWSLSHLMDKKYLPGKILVPTTLQAAHIGMEGGMHEELVLDNNRTAIKRELLPDGNKLEAFHADVKVPQTHILYWKPKNENGFGGWGHPADQEHCMKVFGAEKN